jgi:hypothetical protein
MVKRRKVKGASPRASIKEKEMASYIVPAIAALLVALIGLASYQWGLRKQLKATDEQRRQQAYSQLLGRKAVMSQLYVSRFEALIYSDYHEARWKLSGAPKDSLDLQEAQRWMHKSEDLALEVSKSNQALFETLGLIRSCFRRTQELDSLTDRLYHFKVPQIMKRPFDLDGSQLEAWKMNSVRQLQDLVESEYSKSIDELAAYLSKEMAKDN